MFKYVEICTEKRAFAGSFISLLCFEEKLLKTIVCFENLMVNIFHLEILVSVDSNYLKTMISISLNVCKMDTTVTN